MDEYFLKIKFLIFPVTVLVLDLFDNLLEKAVLSLTKAKTELYQKDLACYHYKPAKLLQLDLEPFELFQLKKCLRNVKRLFR